MDASTGKAHLHRRRWHTATAVVAAAGCSPPCPPAPTRTPSATPVEIAQADVAAKEEALAEAQTAATDAEAQFCTAGSTYITALDRYGDVLHDTAVTVGDVRDRRRGPHRPRRGDHGRGRRGGQHAGSRSPTRSRTSPTPQAALAAAEATAAGQEAPEPAPAEADRAHAPHRGHVTRVQQAQADLDATRGGLSDDTPLAQAAEQFNSAVVALEMAWIQLFVQSGCLSDERQAEAAAPVSAYTVALQQQLADAGYYTGAVDGIYGPQTVAAVEALQNAAGLPRPGRWTRPPRRRSGPARGRGRRGRAGEPGVDRRAPADPQARRVLGRPDRRAVDGRADGRGRCRADGPRCPRSPARSTPPRSRRSSAPRRRQERRRRPPRSPSRRGAGADALGGLIAAGWW